MARDDGRTLTAEEWRAIWEDDEESEEEGQCYVLPKVYPGPRIRCPNCGYWQGNEAVVDTYRWCMRCCTVLQDSSTLYWDSPLGLGPFRVVAASYGHPRDPKLAIDVRPQLQSRVGVSDRLVIGREESLIDWLGDPCPGVLKALRIRYVSLEGVAKGRRREVWLQESEEGHLPEGLSLQVPTNVPLVIVFSAVYGTPGKSARGRGKIDVTEFMQGRIDLADGKYLLLSKKDPLTELFGDPCPGRDKCLVLRYEILGSEGRAEALESDGRLLTPINISCTPMLAPLLLVESATYGQTREGIDERLQLVQRDLSDLFAIQNRKDIGMPIGREDNKRLLRLRPLIAELEHLKKITPKFVDVTACLQEKVEELGGGVLELVAARDDVNKLFGNPLPGKTKELRVRYLVMGHDSERLTSLEEITCSGYPRNFILQRQGKLVVQARDDGMRRGILEKDVLVDSPKVLSVVEILTSSYGHPRNSTKTYDVSTKLRQMIQKQGGEKLVIDCNTDLLKLFDEPCRGVRKKMSITYVARGLTGTIRVGEKDRHLVADIIVGYYSREKFKESKLLPKRYGLIATQSMTTSASRSKCSDKRSARSNVTIIRESEGETRDVSIADTAPDDLCFPGEDSEDDGHDGHDGHDHDQRVRPLPTSASLSLDSSTGSSGEVGSIAPPSVAERRRERSRKRRQAHQEEIRRKEAERESERRRKQSEKGRRDREIARAIREAKEAERVRLLQEAKEAEDAAPIATRLLRTLQRKAAAAVATAASKPTVSADVADDRDDFIFSGKGGQALTTMESDILSRDLDSVREQQKLQQQQQQQRQTNVHALVQGNVADDHRPSKLPLNQGETARDLSEGGDGDRKGTRIDGDAASLCSSHTSVRDGSSFISDANVSTDKSSKSSEKLGSYSPTAVVSFAKRKKKGGALSADADDKPTIGNGACKKGRRKPKKREAKEEGEKKKEKDTKGSSGGRSDQERDAAFPPLSRARAKAAAAGSNTAPDVASATDANAAVADAKEGEPGDLLEGRKGAPFPSRPGCDSAEAKATVPMLPDTKVVGEGNNRPRRKPSEERVREARAVFTHRASLDLRPADSATAGEPSGMPANLQGTGVDMRGGSQHQRLPSKGRVGSVLLHEST